MPIGVYDRGTGAPTCHPDQPYCARGLCKSCYDAEYRAVNRKRVQEWHREHYRRIKTQLRHYHNMAEERAATKLECLAKYGPDGQVRCAWEGCTVTDPDMLNLDHIENDGQSRRIAGEGRGNGLYRKAAKIFIPGLQTLCANHNLKKELLRRRAA